MWIANYNRLSTRSIMVSWGIPVPKECCLCSRYEKTRDHLLLTCDYSFELWNLVLSHLNPFWTLFRSWLELLSWIKATFSVALSLLKKLVIQATIFHLWKQRNNVLHNNISIPANTIYKGIEREVRNSISVRRHKEEIFKSNVFMA